MVERIDEYILEQSVSDRAIPALIVGEAECGSRIFRQSLVPDLHTSGQTMSRYISKKTLTKISNVVQEL